VIAGFDLFDSAPAQASFQVTYVNAGSGECDFVSEFDLNGETFGLSNAGDRASYVIYDEFSSFNATPVAGHTQHSITRRRVHLGPNGSETVTFQFMVRRDELGHDGQFRQQATLQATLADNTVLAGRQVVLGIDVVPSARLGLAGAFTLNGDQAVVDLGDLRRGLAPVPLRLRVDSTRRYDVTFESAQGGNLRMIGTPWAIPYSLLVGDRRVSLAGGDGQYSSGGPNRLRRDNLPLGFIIGDVSDHRAGTYSDTLSITVAPN
jgi:hypothetical protein